MASCGLCQKGQRELFVAPSNDTEYVNLVPRVFHLKDKKPWERGVWLLLFTGNLSSYEKAVQLEVSDTFTSKDVRLWQHSRNLAHRGRHPLFESCIKKRKWFCFVVGRGGYRAPDYGIIQKSWIHTWLKFVWKVLLKNKALLPNNLFPYKSSNSFKNSYCHEFSFFGALKLGHFDIFDMLFSSVCHSLQPIILWLYRSRDGLAAKGLLFGAVRTMGRGSRRWELKHAFSCRFPQLS